MIKYLISIFFMLYIKGKTNNKKIKNLNYKLKENRN